MQANLIKLCRIGVGHSGRAIDIGMKLVYVKEQMQCKCNQGVRVVRLGLGLCTYPAIFFFEIVWKNKIQMAPLASYN